MFKVNDVVYVNLTEFDQSHSKTNEKVRKAKVLKVNRWTETGEITGLEVDFMNKFDGHGENGTHWLVSAYRASLEPVKSEKKKVKHDSNKTRKNNYY